MSILTPHNKSHTAGPQSSPSHMEALRRIRQAYQRQLEQMQITHVLDTRGSDFLTVTFWEAKFQVGQEVWLHLHACLGREEIRRLSAEETMGVQVLLSPIWKMTCYLFLWCESCGKPPSWHGHTCRAQCKKWCWDCLCEMTRWWALSMSPVSH